MEKLKALPIGIQGFRNIIEGDYVYADKTEYVYSLLNDAKYYFLSRPRRFGKSLLLDTIAEVFSGDKELFKGLYIYDSDYEFEKYPVIRFDMSNIANKTPEVLETAIREHLEAYYAREGFDVQSDSPSSQFKFLIEALCEKYKKRVVVLIDEYDKPILDVLTDEDIAKANRSVLSGFYGVLKSMDSFLRFTFITGVSKFTKTSVFSGLNNLLDITMMEDYANICGIPPDELNGVFREHVVSLSGMKQLSHIENIHDEIIAWYDGYSWDGETRVLNPFSLLTFFRKKQFSSYWYSTGTPRFLLDLIKNRPEGYTDLSNFELGEMSMDTFEIGRVEVEPLLFQTGYLTVKEVIPYEAPPVYLVDIPNREVRLAFNLHILSDFAGSSVNIAETSYRRIKQALESGNLSEMLLHMKALFSSIPYQLHIGREAYYHSIFYAMLNLYGFEINAEVSTSGGRLDADLELADKVYIFEFKYVDCSPEATEGEKAEMFSKILDDAMNQIKAKGYADKYIGSGKTVYKAAFAFLGRDNIEMRVE